MMENSMNVEKTGPPNWGINLRPCVKVRKNSPSMHVQHALSLGDLFSEISFSSDFSNIKWQFRRSRSKINRNNDVEPISCDNKQIDHPIEIWAAEDLCNGIPLQNNIQPESNIASETNVELTSAPLELSNVPNNQRAAIDLCNVGIKEEVISGSISWMEVDQSSRESLSVEGCSEVPREICVEEESGADMTIDRGTQLRNLTTTESNMDELVCSCSLQPEENQPIPSSTGACSEVRNGTFVEEKLDVDVTIGNELGEQAWQ